MEHGNDLIFISIASYRDAQLVPTVIDLITKADAPSLLRFGICWQHGDEVTSLPFEGDPRFRVLDIDWRESRGACWARAEIMKLHQGEQWFLQVDSHCRFAQGWDTRLIRIAGLTGSSRPILSTYANPFTPQDADSDSREVLAGTPLQMAVEAFTDDGIPMLKPLPFPAGTFDTALRARFVSAGFLFAPGSFVREVPYDPELYFFGEEISMTLRSWTSGYDLFHPAETIVWHDYIRAYATRHWEDHDPAKSEKTHTWGELDLRSREKVICLFDPASKPAPFGLGTARTLADYEAYAGISFALRKSQDYTRRALEPPNPPVPADWPDRIYSWIVRVAVNRVGLLPEAFHDAQFWMVAIQDEDGQEIRRRDFTRLELEALTGTESQIVLICEIQSGIVPVSWTVWPCTRSHGWLQRLDGTLAESDYAIVTDEP